MPSQSQLNPSHNLQLPSHNLLRLHPRSSSFSSQHPNSRRRNSSHSSSPQSFKITRLQCISICNTKHCSNSSPSPKQSRAVQLPVAARCSRRVCWSVCRLQPRNLHSLPRQFSDRARRPSRAARPSRERLCWDQQRRPCGPSLCRPSPPRRDHLLLQYSRRCSRLFHLRIRRSTTRAP